MWLYVPSPSAPESAASTWGSDALARLARSATSSGKHSAPRVWSTRCKRAPWIKLLSGVTYEPSTLERGVAAWISSLRDFRASRSPRQVAAGVSRRTCGRNACASSETPHQLSFFSRTSPDTQSSAPVTIFSAKDSAQWAPRFQPPNWVAVMTGRAGGFLPTPTRKANVCAPSMAKWPGCAAMQKLERGPTPSPNTWEWMMGFPIGWTAFAHSATPSSPKSRRSRSQSSGDGTGSEADDE